MNPWPPDPIGDGSTPRPALGVPFVVLDGQVVLHDTSRALSHVLNPSAALIWAEVDGRRTVRQIVDGLEGETGADRLVLDRDVKATLARLVQVGVVLLDGDADVATPMDAPEEGPVDVTPTAIDGRPGQVLLEAGAVERDGRVVVVAGARGRDRRDQTAALVQRGFRHLTDDLVALDPHTLDVSGGGQLALVVFLTSGDGVAEGAASESPTIQALLDLLSVTSRPTFADPTALESLAHLVTTTPVVRLRRGATEDVCRQIETLWHDPAPPPGTTGTSPSTVSPE